MRLKCCGRCSAPAELAEAVATAVARDDFEAPDALAQLEVHLVGEFFEAMATGERDVDAVRPSWRPVLRHRGDGLHPLRYAVAGINAHINTDLSGAIVATCLDLDIPVSRGTALFRDYQTINEVAEREREAIEDRFFDEAMQTLNQVLGRIDDLFESWSFRAAREAAWVNADVMAKLPSALASAHANVLDGLCDLFNKSLLSPL